jgi:hypothetical protein
MKKYIVKALKWALSKFDRRPEEIAAWPFPVSRELELVAKKKSTPKKIATHKPAAKKPVTKKTTKKTK